LHKWSRRIDLQWLGAAAVATRSCFQSRTAKAAIRYWNCKWTIAACSEKYPASIATVAAQIHPLL
jgi:hypothetical protein